MIEIVLFFAFILVLAGLIAYMNDGDMFAFVCIFIAGFLVGLAVYFFKDEEKTPSAIDVYRGNTTLEITYRDSVAVDSVVVFKQK